MANVPFDRESFAYEGPALVRSTEKNGYRTVPRSNTPTPYRFTRTLRAFHEISNDFSPPLAPLGTQSFPTASYTGTMSTSSGDANVLTAYNRAYGRLQNFMGDASLGVALATAGQSYDMIARRALQLARVANYARKGQVGKLVSTLYDAGTLSDEGGPIRVLSERHAVEQQRNLRKKSARAAYRRDKARALERALALRPKAKKGSGLFLEYWFGIAPLMGDIHDAHETLTSDFPGTKFRGHGAVPFTSLRKTGDDYAYDRIDYSGRVGCRISCTVAVNNPNLLLANRLGLLNPTEVILDLIPWSFVLGWVSNLSQVVRSYSDWYGLTVSNSVVSWKASFSGTYVTAISDWSGKKWNVRKMGVQTYHSRREVFLSGPPPGPTLLLSRRNPFAGKLGRAASAVALLVQRLPRR